MKRESEYRAGINFLNRSILPVQRNLSNCEIQATDSELEETATDDIGN